MSEQAVSGTMKPVPADVTDADRALLDVVARYFAVRVPLVNSRPVPLFETDTDGLWDAFLAALPSDALRRTYECRACRRFVERFGGLVTISESGETQSAMWPLPAEGVPSDFSAAVFALRRAVDRARVTGVFVPTLPSRQWLGTPVTGSWNHLAVTMPGGGYARGLLTAGQSAAEKKEDYGILNRGLADFSAEIVRNAVQLLSGDHLYRNEKVLGVAEWLLALHERRAATKNARARENMVWLAVATAPPGFAHVRSTMIGTLLEDLAAGMDFADVQKRFAAKMHPLQYQRPTAAPSAGQIAQAEKVVVALDAAGSLMRRFARLEDVTALWSPFNADVDENMERSMTGGMFSHLRPKARESEHETVEAPATMITWEKFARTVLPGAVSIECYTASGPQPYIALTTATNDQSPPILQWDDEARRNPVAWYVYSGGSTPEAFNLRSGAWVKVTTICLLPPQWGQSEPRPHWGEGAILILDGAKDMRWQSVGGGMGFFPEQLRSELHAYRKTLEAYARSATVEGRDESACGIDLRKGQEWNQRVRVTTKLGRAVYRLERWD